MDRPAVHVIVKGRVQGVGYRWWAVDEARRLGLEGWVRNRGDGSVELLAIGRVDAAGVLVEACWQGPDSATVSTVEAQRASDDGSTGFRERPSTLR